MNERDIYKLWIEEMGDSTMSFEDFMKCFKIGRQSATEEIRNIIAFHHNGGICRTILPCVACAIDKEIKQCIGGKG